MRTFLLDTCIWSYWFNPKRQQHANVKRHLQKLPPDAVLGISIITWGEVVYGHKVQSPKQQPVQAEYFRFIQGKGAKTFDIDMHTANKYGELRALLFDRYPPKGKRKSNLRPEQAVDPVTSRELGIQENDLWITAQAATFNLTLVTNDQKMKRIRDIAGKSLHIDNWAANVK